MNRITAKNPLAQSTGDMYVVKRNGKREEVSFDKITKRLRALKNRSPSLKVDVIKVAQKVVAGVYRGVKTSELDEFAAETAVDMRKDHLDYGTLASRLIVSNLHKLTPNTFKEAMEIVASGTAAKNPANSDAGILSKTTLSLARTFGDAIEARMDYDVDFEYDYFGMRTLMRSYLLRVNGTIVERPQHMLMRVALGVHPHSLEDAFKLYEILSKKYMTLATPTLFNSGTHRPQMSSCFLLDIASDSIEGIYDTLKQCAVISKNAGGIGLASHKIRSRGADIHGTGGKSNGLVPMLRVFNDTARYVDQGGGKRKGAFAIYLEPWHPDVLDFLDLKKNHGKEEIRARDLFYAMWVPDLFMKRVESGESWSFFDPDECPGLSEAYGDEFEKLYTRYEEEGVVRRTLPAREILDKIIESQIETGTPYMLYKDACNSKSNQKNLGTIKSSNLCVGPHTRILTNKGYQVISTLKDQDVEIWNGFEWSPTTVRQTGKDKQLLRVTFSNGSQLDCTPEHKFYVSRTDGSLSSAKEVRASELAAGNQLIDHHLPIVPCDGEMDHPYTHGFFCGCSVESASVLGKTKEYEDVRTYPHITLSGEKKRLIEHLEISSMSETEEHIVCSLHPGISAKYTVPFSASVRQKITWLEGYADANGCIIENGDTEGLQFASKNKSFLVDVMLMLQTLSIHSTVVSENEVHVLRILPSSLFRLYQLEFAPKYLHGKVNLKMAGEGAVKVLSVEPLDGEYDTFCFTENKRHLGTFEGVVTGQCAEIVEYSSPEETAVCNLCSIALPKFLEERNGKLEYNFEKLAEIASFTAKTLNAVIDENYYPTKETKHSNMRHRPIGIGVQGLADVFCMLKLPFTSPEAQKINKEIFEAIYYGAVSASCELAEKDGSYPSYLENGGCPASKGILQFDMWGVKPSDRFDWKVLKGRIAKYGLRNSLMCALMPTASTSQILGNNECFEPFTNNIYTRRTLSGDFVVTNKHLVRDLTELGLWNPTMRRRIIAMRGSVQSLPDIPDDVKAVYKTVWEIKQLELLKMASDRGAFIDQSQSMNIFMAVPTIPKIRAMHLSAWKKGLKTGMYYLRTQPAANTQQFTVSKEDRKEAHGEEEEPETPLDVAVEDMTDADELQIVGEVCRMEAGCLSCGS